jgi:hypothetical protein
LLCSSSTFFLAIALLFLYHFQTFSHLHHHTSSSGIVFLLNHNLLYFGYGSKLATGS